ncbi:hypothetical protein [Nonomuraea jiangxiensis]|uniref:hypothetical protein n=1 Tax=Nonomuraea jiangxiensis TaxID=633440 RepID=UPI0015A2394A|nr:hypothetical protein [Nonomuraea jiangxiensis]
MPDEIGDGLDGYALVTHDGDERVTQFAGTPGGSGSRSFGDLAECPSYVRAVQRGADARAEHQLMILPSLAGLELEHGMAGVVLPERLRRELWQFERAA